MPNCLSKAGHRLHVLLLLSLLSACAGQQVASTNQIEQKAAATAEKRLVTTKDAIALAKEELQKAEQAQLAFFSPLHLEQAQNNLALAEKYAREPKAGEPNAAIEAALSAREFIKKGLSNKDDVLVYLKEAIAHKRLLQKLGVPDLYKEPYQEVLFGFSNLIRIIEEGEPDVALNKQKPLRDKMYQLEIDALIHIHLSEAMSILAQAEDNDAEQYAPVSFYNAKHKIDSTENFIRNNYRDRKGIEKAGIVSLRLAKEAHEVGIMSKKLMKLDSAGSEQYVLNEIQRLQSFMDLAGENTLPPQSLERSTLDVTEAFKKMTSQQNALQAKITNLEQELQRYTSVTLNGMSSDTSEGIEVVHQLSTKDLGDEPALAEDEQGFDSIEYVE